MSRLGYDLYMPCPPIPAGQTPESWLRQLTSAGIAGRYGSPASSDAAARAERELAVVVAMRAASYMLVVAEYVNWAKEKGILVSPGRGHVAGSVLAYVLGITDVDPVRHGLLSERFISAEVLTFPDIDLDIEWGRRREVIDHIVSLYGKDCVAATTSPPTQAKPYRVHAAGILIADRPVSKITPVRSLPPSSRPVWLREVQQQSELDYIRCEQLGLSKFDLLSLKDLRTIQRTVVSVAGNHGVIIRPWSSDIPLDDAATLEMLCAGATDGVFQINGPRIQQCLRDLQPDSFADLTALIALYRPAPIEHGILQAYIARRHTPSAPWSVHPELDLALQPILGATHGLLVYQEQLMMVANMFAGMTLGEGDRLRRTLHTDDPKAVETHMAEFTARVVANGHSAASADVLGGMLLANRTVVFQKCHAVAYALITYTAVYIKAHYPDEFSAAGGSS